MKQWVLNKRTNTAHVAEGATTLCNWWAGDMEPINRWLDDRRVCSVCAAKLRKINVRLSWSEPVVYRHDRHSFVAKINKRVRQSMALEAAQKGYWGIL